MKLFSPLMKARIIPREPVPFEEIVPLKLKERVSGKGVKKSDVCCLYEMSVMLTCLKDNEFSQLPCDKEIDLFQKCYHKHIEEKQFRKERDAKGILTPKEKNLTPKQINMLLKRFPNI